MISLRQVTCLADTRVLLDSVSVELQAQRVALIGANGSGKSTFARLLNGLLLPDAGQVQVNGLDSRTHGKVIRQKVGFVFQNPDIQFVFPTVEEDLAFGLRNLGLDNSQISQRIDQTLSFYGLERLRHSAVHTLSGGEKQLLCVAAVLVMQPGIIVFDEPTTLLDLQNTRRINEVIMQLDQQTVVVTHDLEFAAQCEQVVLLDRGRIIACGTAASVISRYVDLACSSNHNNALPGAG